MTEVYVSNSCYYDKGTTYSNDFLIVGTWEIGTKIFRGVGHVVCDS